MILFPLFGSIFNGLVLRPKSARRAGVIASFAAAISFFCALSLFTELRTNGPVAFSYEWLTIGLFQLKWGFVFDVLTAVMAIVVTGIGTLIHLYSIGYMSEEKTPSRYFAYLNLFLFNMLVLISADNLPVLFVGWEGVGLCSYLLIGYWYEDLEKAHAGMKAFLVNRIGDTGFLIGMFLIFQIFQTLEFKSIGEIIAGSNSLDLTLLNLAALFLFIGATGKSAQIPLYVWLPDAMAGPTPVSALIHAATMVTAGIYMICRMQFLFQVTAITNLGIATIGMGTALLAALIATSQKDIKKVLAYSTVSQLGFMFVALGAGAYFAAVFHLMTHAFFKALLFLGAGSVIHALHHEQDISHMGGLRTKLPWTFLTFTIATAAICGIPPLSGFFSKDTILFATLEMEHYGKTFWFLGLIASSLTAFYMTRLYLLVFFGQYRGHAHPHESPAIMTVPLAVLAIGSAFAGFVGMPHGLHLLPNYMAEFLSPVLPIHPEGPTPVSEISAMVIATGLALTAICVSCMIYSNIRRAEALGSLLKPVKFLFENKFFIDELYGILFIRPFQLLSKFFARFFDGNVIDASALLPTKVLRGTASAMSFIQSGSSQLYLLIMLLGCVILFWITLKGPVL